MDMEDSKGRKERKHGSLNLEDCFQVIFLKKNLRKRRYLHVNFLAEDLEQRYHMTLECLCVRRVRVLRNIRQKNALLLITHAT